LTHGTVTRPRSSNVKKTAGLEEPVRAVRIGTKEQHALKARVPWRNLLTPFVAPRLHWYRGFAEYEKAGYKSSGREGEEGSIALEVYVTGAKDSYQYIDYVIFMGDNTHTWDDALPLADTDFTEDAASAME
jgi:hypothetical protein